MARKYSVKSRNELKTKMASVFNEKIQILSKELQEILLDDLVTAFENRLTAFNRAQSTITLETAEGVRCETF
jgi:hypothetical protein